MGKNNSVKKLTDNKFVNLYGVDATSVHDLSLIHIYTGCNMAVIYQNMGDYENAKKKLQQVLKTYGEDYRVYKDLAFLEVSVQGETAEDDRDYSKFKEYYDKAKELYQKQLSANANDVEMDRLDELYQQAVNSGWISG